MIACTALGLGSNLLHYGKIGSVGRLVGPGCSAPPVVVGFAINVKSIIEVPLVTVGGWVA